MTQDERALAISMLAQPRRYGNGWRAIATAITERRTKHLRSAESREARAVSSRWVMRQLGRLNRGETATVAKPEPVQEPAEPDQNAEEPCHTLNRTSSPEIAGEKRASPVSETAGQTGIGPDSERGSKA